VLTIKHKTVPYTFRVSDEILSQVEKEAKDKGISVSGLVGQIVTKYAKSDRYFDQLGFLPMSKDVLRKWLNRIDEKFLVEDSKELGSTIAREYISYFFHDVNKDTLLQFLDLWFSRFDSYQHKTDGEVHKFAINHDINMKYSLYMKELLRALIEPIILKKVEFLELTPNVISLSFEVRAYDVLDRTHVSTN